MSELKIFCEQGEGNMDNVQLGQTRTDTRTLIRTRANQYQLATAADNHLPIVFDPHKNQKMEIWNLCSPRKRCSHVLHRLRTGWIRCCFTLGHLCWFFCLCRRNCRRGSARSLLSSLHELCEKGSLVSFAFEQDFRVEQKNLEGPASLSSVCFFFWRGADVAIWKPESQPSKFWTWGGGEGTQNPGKRYLQDQPGGSRGNSIPVIHRALIKIAPRSSRRFEAFWPSAMCFGHNAQSIWSLLFFF